MPQPSVVVLAGPNGAGKSTTAPWLLRGTLGVTEFVNADVIAQGLSGFAPEGAAIAAGRVMLTRLRDLARQRASFAFETTLANRALARWLARLSEDGYIVHIVFLWMPNARLCEQRVAERVRMGGHAVPVGTIRRRYVAGLRNFLTVYRRLAATWRVYDASGGPPPTLVARAQGAAIVVRDPARWQRIEGSGRA
jgi:predicted ABC-type ATPase